MNSGSPAAASHWPINGNYRHIERQLSLAERLDWVTASLRGFWVPTTVRGPRQQCAVLGKFCLTQCDQLPQTLAANHLITQAAESIRGPILQHVQWRDELFPREGQLALFDLFTSTEKILRARPGEHALTRPDDEIAWREHVTAYLN